MLTVFDHSMFYSKIKAQNQIFFSRFPGVLLFVCKLLCCLLVEN